MIDFFLGLQNLLLTMSAALRLKMLAPLEGKLSNLDSVLKSRDITLLTKLWIVKAWVFQYGFESWIIKKAESWRIDAFKMWCWKRLLRVPWTARRSSLSILKESTLNIHWKADAEAETPILWPADAKNWLVWKDPDAGTDWRQEEKGMTEDKMVG